MVCHWIIGVFSADATVTCQCHPDLEGPAWKKGKGVRHRATSRAVKTERLGVDPVEASYGYTQETAMGSSCRRARRSIRRQEGPSQITRDFGGTSWRELFNSLHGLTRSNAAMAPADHG